MSKKFTARERRAIELLSTRPAGAVELRTFVGVLNVPELIAGLRRKLGFDSIVTERFKVVDRDGHACHPGMYHLTAEGKAALAEMGVAP